MQWLNFPGQNLAKKLILRGSQIDSFYWGNLKFGKPDPQDLDCSRRVQLESTEEKSHVVSVACRSNDETVNHFFALECSRGELRLALNSDRGGGGHTHTDILNAFTGERHCLNKNSWDRHNPCKLCAFGNNLIPSMRVEKLKSVTCSCRKPQKNYFCRENSVQLLIEPHKQKL